MSHAGSGDLPAAENELKRSPNLRIPDQKKRKTTHETAKEEDKVSNTGLVLWGPDLLNLGPSSSGDFLGAGSSSLTLAASLGPFLAADTKVELLTWETLSDEVRMRVLSF